MKNAPKPLLTDEQQYLSEVRHLPLISEDEYARLAEQIRFHRHCEIDPQIGQAATERMLAGHLRLVARLAWKWAVLTNTQLDYLDLIQIGNTALITAMHEYPFDEEGKLGKYLCRRVAWAIINAIYNTANTIRISSATIHYARKKGRAHELPLQPISLDQLTENQQGEERELIDTLQAPAFILRPPPECPSNIVQVLALLFAELHPRERAVLQLRYGLSDDGLVHPIDEIMAILGIAENTVHDHERRAMQHIRDIYADYEQETGHASTYLSYDEDFHIYLEQRCMARKQFGTDPRIRVVNAQLYEALAAMQASGEKITITTLTRKAGVSRKSATRYLQQHGGYQTDNEQIQQRLKAAYSQLRRTRRPFTCQQLADLAHTCKTAAAAYLKRQREKEGQHGT